MSQLGTSLYFTSYDSFRYLLDTPRFAGVQSGLAPFLGGSTCGILSWFLVSPIDLVKTRIQRDALSGVKDREGAVVVFNRLRAKGLARLYRGLGVSAGRSALSESLCPIYYQTMAELSDISARNSLGAIVRCSVSLRLCNR